MARHIAAVRAKGVRVLPGGEVEDIGGGLSMRPTVLSGAAHDMLIMREETFGPTIPVLAYRDDEEATAHANNIPFGLTASVIASSEEEALAIRKRLNAGGIFCPDTFLTFAKLRTFGTASFGVSGLGGARIGPESIKRFLRSKSLMTQRGPEADIQDDHHLGPAPGRSAGA